MPVDYISYWVVSAKFINKTKIGNKIISRKKSIQVLLTELSKRCP